MNDSNAKTSSPSRPITRRLVLRLMTAAPLAAAMRPATAGDMTPSGRVTIKQTQIAFIGSGNLGGGTLDFGGRRYRFSIGGLGVGGFGISQIEAEGTVYNLAKLSDFPGAYAQGRYGMVVGNASTGQLWLANAQGVYLSLNAKRKGLALSLGGDAIYIDLT